MRTGYPFLFDTIGNFKFPAKGVSFSGNPKVKNKTNKLFAMFSMFGFFFFLYFVFPFHSIFFVQKKSSTSIIDRIVLSFLNSRTKLPL